MFADIFLRRRAEDGHAWPHATDELEAILAVHVTAARAAWPGLALTDADFIAHLADRLPDDADLEALRATRAAELYVARAAADGDARAIVAFEERYFGE